MKAPIWNFKFFIFALMCCFISSSSLAGKPVNNPHTAHYKNIMIVIFENMSYEIMSSTPVFKRLIEYSGYTLDENGSLIKLAKKNPATDRFGNGYAFFNNYHTNHKGGMKPTRPSQPNYFAMTSGSTHGISDNDMHDLDVDNLVMELKDANLTWKVYAENLPDPLPPLKLPVKKAHANAAEEKTFAQNLLDYNAQKTSYIENGYYPDSGCYIGEASLVNGKKDDEGYARKHEPFISYQNIQRDRQLCGMIVNANQLAQDINNLPAVSFYIPNQKNDGHHGSSKKRLEEANAFLAKMLGLDPETGEPLSDASKAPFNSIMAQNGLLVITFDEPSTHGSEENTIYTLMAGKMINSNAYPGLDDPVSLVCFPPEDKQTDFTEDKYGTYPPASCNHYNLLKMIEKNWHLRGLKNDGISAGYYFAFPLDSRIPSLWKNKNE